MEVHFAPEIETRLSELATQSGRPANEFVQDAMASYLDDLSEVKDLLEARYLDVVEGKVTPVDGETFFASLLGQEHTLQRQRSR